MKWDFSEYYVTPRIFKLIVKNPSVDFSSLPPMWQQFFDELKERHKIYPNISLRMTGKWTYHISTWDTERGIWETSSNMISWIDRQDAMEAACIEIMTLLGCDVKEEKEDDKLRDS